MKAATIFVVLLVVSCSISQANKPLIKNHIAHSSGLEMQNEAAREFYLHSFNGHNSTESLVVVNKQLHHSNIGLSGLSSNLKPKKNRKAISFAFIGAGLICAVVGITQLPSDSGKAGVIVGTGFTMVGLLMPI